MNIKEEPDNKDDNSAVKKRKQKWKASGSMVKSGFVDSNPQKRAKGILGFRPVTCTDFLLLASKAFKLEGITNFAEENMIVDTPTEDQDPDGQESNKEHTMKALADKEHTVKILADTECVAKALANQEHAAKALSNEEHVAKALANQERTVKILTDEECVAKALTDKEHTAKILADMECVAKALADCYTGHTSVLELRYNVWREVLMKRHNVL